MGAMTRSSEDVWREIQTMCRELMEKDEPIPTLGGAKRPRKPVDNYIDAVLPDRIVRRSIRVRTEPSVIRRSEVVRVWHQLDMTQSCRGGQHYAFTDALFALLDGIDNDGRHVTLRR